MYLKAHQEAHKQLSTKIKSLKGQLRNLGIYHETSLGRSLDYTRDRKGHGHPILLLI